MKKDAVKLILIFIMVGLVFFIVFALQKRIEKKAVVKIEKEDQIVSSEESVQHVQDESKRRGKTGTENELKEEKAQVSSPKEGRGKVFRGAQDKAGHKAAGKQEFLKPEINLTTYDEKFDLKDKKDKSIKGKKDLVSLSIDKKSSMDKGASFSDKETSLEKPKMEIQPVGNISGIVVLEDSLFNEGVSVSLEKTVYYTYTDEKGCFSFQGIPVGTYTLVAKIEEYVPEKRENIVVSKSKTLNVPKIIVKPNFDIAYPKIIRTKPERNSKDVLIPNSFDIKGVDVNKHTGFCICLDFSKPMPPVAPVIIITLFIF